MYKKIIGDRYLMERVTDDQYALIDGDIRHLPGGVDEYLDIMAARGAATAAQESASTAQTAVSPEVHGSAQMGASSARPLGNKELHQARKDLASLERKLATAEKNLEKALAAQLTVDPTDYEALIAAQREVDAARERKDDLEMDWLELAELVGE